MGSSLSTQDAYAYMLATIILASLVGFLMITLIITCCCCFKQQRKLLRTGYGPESGGPRRGRTRQSRKPGMDKNVAQWKMNPYDRYVDPGQSSPACPICHSRVACGCRNQAPTQNWIQNDKDRSNALPRSNPYPPISDPLANRDLTRDRPGDRDYDRVLRNAQVSGREEPYGALPPPKIMSSAVGGARAGQYSADYAPSSQLGVGNAYNNMGSSTAQFVLESSMERARF